MIVPHTAERRADTGVTNVELGVWLFLVSEVMLFGALFSAYALLRASAAAWPSGRDVLSLPLGLTNTVLLVAATSLVWRARTAAPASLRRMLLLASIPAIAFLGFKGAEYGHELSNGLLPATSTFLAMSFTLTGLHALHVIAGLAANLWVMAGAARVDARLTAGRVWSLSIYWIFVDAVWLLIFVLTYLS